MPRYFGYLRVSTEGQEVESQKIGLLAYADRLGFDPVEITQEKVSRAKDWRKRKLGELLDKAGHGDIILTPEFSRLGATPGQVFSFLEAASLKEIVIHITKSGTVMNGSMQSMILASVFSMASMIELEFIQARTREGLKRARSSGKQMGRPKGATGKSKLDDKIIEVKGYAESGWSKRKMARVLGVSYNTVDHFVKREKIDIVKL